MGRSGVKDEKERKQLVLHDLHNQLKNVNLTKFPLSNSTDF